MSIKLKILRLRQATLVKQDQLIYTAKLGQNRWFWENKAYPISNTSFYMIVGVCHASWGWGVENMLKNEVKM